MKKNLKVLSAVIFFAMIFTLSACSKDPNDKITVATVDGEKITKTEYLETWENVKVNYNIDDEILADEANAEDLDALRKSVVESLVTQEVVRIELENLGYYEFTETEHEDIKSQTDTVLNNILSSKQEEMLAELGDNYTEKDEAKVKIKYLEIALDEYGYTEESIEDYFKYNIAVTNAISDLVDSTVTDEDVVALYNERVEADVVDFEDLAMYEYYSNDGQTQIYYVPSGLRMVRHVLIILDDAKISEISALRSEEKDDEADKLLEKYLAEIYDEAYDVLVKIKSEDITFDQAIEEYNDDQGMASNPDGYMMSLETTNYVQPFTDAGMALENVGDVSELVATDYGYHIIEYTSDVEPGPIDIETVRDALTTELIEQKENEGWNALIEEWIVKHEIEYFYDELAEEIPEATEVPTAEAQ